MPYEDHRVSFAQFLPVGDPWQFEKVSSEWEKVRSILDGLRMGEDYIIVDCRGGIDDHSLVVCAAADEIILVVETDTTSFQATQHLVDVLSQNRLSRKIRGFIINKAFEDPQAIVRSGNAVFKAQFLGAIPFDFEAMRAFFVGNIPDIRGIFATHVWAALTRLDATIGPPLGRVWLPEDLSEIGAVNQDSNRGGLVTALITIYAYVTYVVALFKAMAKPFEVLFALPGLYVTLFAALALAGSSERWRRTLGHALTRIVFRRRAR
jgi:septum site-determining protein MinD